MLQHVPAFLAATLLLTTAIDLPAQEGSPQAGIEIAAEVDHTTVPLNRTLSLKVTVSWQGALDRFDVQPPDVPELSNLEIVRSASSNWVGEQAGMSQAIKVYDFTLRPLELGMAYIEPVTLSYLEKGDSLARTLQTSRLAITVTEPIPERERGGMWLWLPPLVVVAAAGVGVWVWRRRRKLALESATQEEEPLEEQFLAELRHRVDPNAPDLDDDFAEVSRLLRRFLAERYGLPTRGISTTELINSLQATPLGESQIQRIQEALTLCDVAKFSGGASSQSELMRAYTLVETFLEEHRQLQQQAPSAAAMGEETSDGSSQPQ